MDARFPERWLNDRRVVRLSDAGFRLFVTSLAWSVSNRTDGHFDKDDLELLAHVDSRHVDELTTAGLMEQIAPGCWQSTVYLESQSSKAQLDGLDYKREQDRRRQANKRAKDRGFALPFPDESRDSPPDVTVDVERDTKARQGQAKQGQASTPKNPARSEATPPEATGTEALKPPRSSFSSSVPVPCPHGVPDGQQRDPWADGRMLCARCSLDQT